MRGRLATECHYSQEYIDHLEFPTVLRMADYWNLEPPLSYLTRVYWGFGRKEEEAADGLHILPRHITPFQKLPKPIQQLHIARWLRLNPGKTENDFFKHLQAKRLERFGDALKEARTKKDGK
jgi:hypothetical protein